MVDRSSRRSAARAGGPAEPSPESADARQRRAAPRKLTPGRAVLARWFEIFGLSAAGPAVVALAAPALFPVLGSYVAGNNLGLPVLVLILLLSLYKARGRWLGWSGLLHFARHPPAWAAGLIGYSMLELFWTHYPAALLTARGGDMTATAQSSFASPVPLALWCLGAVGAGALLSLLFERLIPSPKECWRRRTAPSPAPAPQCPDCRRPTLSLGDFQDVREWLRTDDAIEGSEQDAFGHDTVARRIARRLAGNPGDEGQPPTIAVVGPLGSGKTSILNLTRRHLESMGTLDRSVLLVPVSLWPFENVEAAVRGILSRLIGELSHHVNPACLASLPSRYAEAIADAGSWWTLFGGLLRDERSPEATLERLESVAAAIGLRIVLWVEDLERFAGTANLGAGRAGDDAGTANERLGPIRSLLHLLDRRQQITVVLSSNTLDARFDMDKLARFIERVPSVGGGAGEDLLELFRRGCLDMLNEQKRIDPGQVARRERLAGGSPDGQESPEEVLGMRSPTLAECLVILCGTPRRVKQALRSALDVWEPLVGEIDPDDVLVWS